MKRRLRRNREERAAGSAKCSSLATGLLSYRLERRRGKPPAAKRNKVIVAGSGTLMTEIGRLESAGGDGVEALVADFVDPAVEKIVVQGAVGMAADPEAPVAVEGRGSLVVLFTKLPS